MTEGKRDEQLLFLDTDSLVFVKEIDMMPSTLLFDCPDHGSHAEKTFALKFTDTEGKDHILTVLPGSPLADLLMSPPGMLAYMLRQNLLLAQG